MTGKLYAIIFTETKELLSPNSFNDYWPKYGSNHLYGWRKPKKIYHTLGQAKAGLAHIPQELIEHLSIAEFSFDKIVDSATTIRDEQDIKKQIRKEKADEQYAKWRLEKAQADLAKAQKQLEELKS